MSSLIDYVVYRGGKLYWCKRPTNRVRVGDEVGTVARTGYRATKFKGVNYQVHRVIWELFNGSIPDGYEVDHRDNDRTNNDIGNLRLATRGQNSQNHKIHHNKLGVKGMWVRQRGNCLQYTGVVKFNGKAHQFSNTDREKVEGWLKQKRESLHGHFANHG